MLKIILDTNVFLSGFIFGGICEDIFDLIYEDNFYLCVSAELQEELLRKFEDFKATADDIQELAELFEDKGNFFAPTITIDACRDPNDNFLLELAETAKAAYLITGDKDLLVLGEWKETKIVKPGTFLQIWRTM